MSDQEKKNKAIQANQLKENPLLNEIFVSLKASYLEKLTKVKKGRHYEDELKDIHDSLQNLIRIEAYIDRCITSGRVVDIEQKRKGLFR